MNQNYRIPPEHLNRLSRVYRTTWQTWSNARNRCYNADMTAYEFYGARGVRMADCWLNDFEAFLTYMGPRPLGTTFDRLRGTMSHYEPGNVQWATKETRRTRQRHTTNKTHRNLSWTIDGEYLDIKAMAARLNITVEVLRTRVVRYQWTTDQLLGISKRPREPRVAWKNLYANELPIGPQKF